MLERTIVTSQGVPYKLTSEDPVIIDWFARTEVTSTDIIIDQLNNDHIYDRFFTGRRDMTVIDLGANIGLFSLYAQDSCQKLISVEPASHNFYLLEALTKDFDHIVLEQAAICDKNEPVTLHIHSGPCCGSLLEEVIDIDGVSIEVPGKTIETLIKEHELSIVDFIKCDIEGGEMFALTDATLAPVSDIVTSWWVECHQTNNKKTIAWPGNLEQNRQKLVSIFKNAGYSTEVMLHDQLYAWK